MAEALLPRLRQRATRRRNWLLDITTDIGVPCVAAVSCGANGFGFAFGLAARPTLKASARSASWKCANSNSPLRSSRQSAARAARPRSTSETGVIGGAPR